MKLTVLILTALACLATGCSHKGVKPLAYQGTGKSSVHWAYMDSNYRQSVIVVKEDGKAYIVSEPAPDTALKSTLDLGAKVKVEEAVDVDLTVKYATEVAQLAKRTVAVGVLRDALYKMSELRAVDGEIKDNEKELFESILNTVEQIALAEANQSKAELVKQLNNAGNSLTNEQKADILKTAEIGL